MMCHTEDTGHDGSQREHGFMMGHREDTGS